MRDGSRFGKLFQSTLPARGATPDIIFAGAYNVISIHAPCTGSDGGGRIPSLYAQSFQSTLPARGATALNGAPVDFAAISIHAPCTGSDTCADVD